MNKIAGIVLFFLLIISFTAFSSTPTKSLMEEWVDSVYHSLTYEQRIGQLIVSKKSSEKILDLVRNGDLPIGGVFLDPSNISYSKETILGILKNSRQLFWTFTDGGIDYKNLSSGIHSIPNDISRASIRNINVVNELCQNEVRFLKSFGANVFHEKKIYLENINGEFIHQLYPSALTYAKQNELVNIKNDAFQNEDFLLSVNLDLTFDNFDFVKYIPENLYRNDGWQSIKNTYPILFLNEINIKSNWDGDKFRREIIKELIRKKFDHQGVIALDLEKNGMRFSQDKKRNTTESELIRLGIDVIVTDKPIEVYELLYTEWKKHEIRNNEIEERVKQILKLRFQQQYQNDDGDPYTTNPIVKVDELENSVYESYAQSITLIENGSDLIPLRNLETKSFASLSIGADEMTRFQETLGKYAGFVHFVLPANQINADAFNKLVKTLSSFDVVVVGIHAPFNKDMLSLLASIDFNTTVITSIFDEKVPDNLESVTNSLLLTYENNEYTQELAPQIIFGARPGMGQYPYLKNNMLFSGIQTNTVNRLAYAKPFVANMDKGVLYKIDEIAEEAIVNGATPGCQILVAKNGNVVYEKSFGNYTYDSLKAVTNQTLYDLASITKVAATTQAVMFLVNQGALDLNEKLSTYLPELEGTNKADLIIKDILTHQSGLKGFLPLWYQTIDFENLQVPFYSSEPDDEYALEVGFGMYGSIFIRDSIYRWTIDSELRKKPRRRKFEPYDYKYSDLGFYLMYVLVERLLNQPMDEFLTQNFYEPLGMSSTMFNPLCNFQAVAIAPTEDDKVFRHSLVWGTVHDQIAAMNGGVSGHAGLFGNAIDLAKLAQMHLLGGEYGGQKYFDSYMIDEFTSAHSEENRRGLGWDKPDPNDRENNPASNYASINTYGHRGFTGTVIWVDPDEDLIYVFLSNRIFPNMSNNKLNELDIRKRIHDVVYESISNFEVNLN